MAKLSLWLLTLAKDKPFEFLDHAIRCGDSLVGIHRLDQVRQFNLDPSQGRNLFTGPILNLVDEAVALRQKIEAMPSNTVEDAEAQEKLLAEAEEKTARLRCAADLLLSIEFQGASAADKQSLHDSMAIQAGHHVENGTIEEFRQAVRKALKEQQTFHWPLEFPEAFQKRGGFDAVVGNPPFMGGSMISGTFGKHYRVYLVEHLAGNQRRNADIVGFFFLRGNELLRCPGGFGLLATNTIAQGDTREVALDRICQSGGKIIRAIPSKRWPGDASLEVAMVHCRKGAWASSAYLDETPVGEITSFLTAGSSDAGLPQRMVQNAGKSFMGSYVLGMGFVLSTEEAETLLAKSPKYQDVLFKFLIGEDLNTNPDQSPSRWVIYFSDWPLEKVKQYEDCFAIVQEKVKPERATNNVQSLRDTWWRFKRPTPQLYTAISSLKRVLVVAGTSRTLAFAFVAKGMIFSHATYVFALDEGGDFAVMQSAFHETWARQYSSTMKGDLRYTNTDVFETFPFPLRTTSCEGVGDNYHEFRRQIMLSRQEGLTKTYNRFHDTDESSADIVQLRQLHVEMGHLVAVAYGWTDLDLTHGFHQTKQGPRYTISEPARREVLARLLKLNHERYAEEVRQGLHEKKKPRNTRKTRKKTEEGGGMFG